MTNQSDIKKLAEQMASSMKSFDDIKDFQKQLMQSFIDTALEAEMEEHLGYPKHETALKVLVNGLIDLGILAGDVDKLIENKAYMPFFMHGTGHWLGLDVHDAGRYLGDDGEPRPLQAGMVITVEPGLYFALDNELVPEQYRGMGIRIEDDVVITEGEPLVLTSDVPKTVQEIEALMIK